MKRFAGIVSVLVLFAAPMFGSSSKKPQTVVIPEAVQVGSTKLPAGTYKLAWTGTGQEVQATLTLAGKTVVTFAAKAIETKNGHPGVDVYTHAGVASLKAILLDKVNLEIESTQQPTGVGGSLSAAQAN
jgi:hypothetical protein